MKNFTLRKFAGTILIFMGLLGMFFMVFFYGAVLFTDRWPSFEPFYEAFYILFSTASGILVIYAAFFALFIPFLLVALLGAWLFNGKRYFSRALLLVILLIWAVSLFLGSVTVFTGAQKVVDRVKPFSEDPVVFPVEGNIPLEVSLVFKSTLKSEVDKKLGTPIEGYEPFMFMEVFPGLSETDFNRVEASIGHYAIEGGRLVHVMDNTRLIHSAAKAISDRGMDTLLANLSVRLGIDLSKDGTVTKIMEAISTKAPVQNSRSQQAIYPPVSTGGEMVACTMDAKICPDGSAVGRVGPNCEFAPCP